MVLNSLGIVTLLNPILGYKQCAEVAREGYLENKSVHQIVVQEKNIITQEKWDELFSFENPAVKPTEGQARGEGRGTSHA